MWSPADIADALEVGLRDHAARLDVEQAVYGLDALDEVALHPILADCMQRAGYGVHREQRYPADCRRRSASEGERCDFVLTPDGQALAPYDLVKHEQTLFDPANPILADEAFWMEVKVVAQFTTEGPNRQYSSQLLSNVRHDVSKLSKDRDILHAGLLIVLWTADERIARHDLEIWHQRCLDQMLPVALPSMRVLPITDRIGHGVCAIGVAPVSHA
jgi:hypothetical protein